jgi:hypothetical protein
MILRCTDPTHKSFKDYGGRGIKVCERWLKFENFLADVGLRPSPLHSIDRFPNNNGNYEPGNVRWATDTEQQNNRRNNRLVEWNGETHTIAEWAALRGLNHGALLKRIDAGWDPERAMTLPAYRGNRWI